jgi:hypothetical protein
VEVRILRITMLALAVVLALLPSAASADQTATNGYYRVDADTFGSFSAATGLRHSLGANRPLVYGGFDLLHSYTTGTDYPLAYGSAALTTIPGGLRQTIAAGKPDGLTVEQDAVVTGTSEADSLLRFTLRVRNTGAQPVRIGARTTLDMLLGDDEGPVFGAQTGSALTDQRRFQAPSFRTFTLIDHGGALKARWTAGARDTDATAPDVLDTAPCCSGGYPPLVPTAPTADASDTEVRWIWGDGDATARTIAPGSAAEFSVEGTLGRAAPTTNATLPSVTGTARTGSTLTGDRGTWQGATALTSFSLQWLRCDSAGAACVPITGATGASYTPVAADAGRRLRFRVTPEDGDAADSPATVAVVNPDSTPPVLTGPSETFSSLVGSSSDLAGGTQIRTSWSATDASGICSYTLKRSIDGGAYEPLALSSAKATSFVETLPQGATYRYYVSAKDCAGKTASAYGPVTRFALWDVGKWPTTSTGSWLTAAVDAALGGSQRYSTHAGDKVSFTTSMRTVAFISRGAPTRGRANVYLDGVLDQTIDLSRTGTSNRMTMYQHTFPAVATHTITVENLATADRPRIEADAFATLR